LIWVCIEGGGSFLFFWRTELWFPASKGAARQQFTQILLPALPRGANYFSPRMNLSRGPSDK
jgi:hypothetical protein